MKEFIAYDSIQSLSKESNKDISLPLLSWEFYGTHLGLNGQYAKERADIHKVTQNWNTNFDFQKQMVYEKNVVIITDTHLNIVFASANIYQLNGYTPNEVIGKTPKLFQGENTCTKTSKRIRKAINDHRPFSEQILNYKKNKESYYCTIKGFPVFNQKGDLINYIAFETAA